VINVGPGLLADNEVVLNPAEANPRVNSRVNSDVKSQGLKSGRQQVLEMLAARESTSGECWQQQQQQQQQ
jgi:hypothetical protein